jgi:hypothetical protein
MRCLACHKKVEADSKFCNYCKSQRLFDLGRSVWILIGIFFALVCMVLLLVVAGEKFGLLEIIIASAPGLAWAADVLLKWAFGLSTRSSGTDLTFGAFSASVVLLVIVPNGTKNSSYLVLGSLVLGFLWLFGLVLAAIADYPNKRSSDSLIKLAKYIFPDHAMWSSIILGIFSALSVAYLSLIFGG